MTEAPKRIWAWPDKGNPESVTGRWSCNTYSSDLTQSYLLAAEHERLMAERDAEIARLREAKDGAYDERNRLVALLASIFPSGRAETNIPGWDAAWHGCVYIDFPWGQASWHFHDSQTHLFAHLPAYLGEWDGHTTEDKYEAIARAALGDDNG